MTDFYRRITAEPEGVSLRELWRCRDLILLLTRKKLLLGYKQTVLGPFWILLQPVLNSLVYAFVFGGVAGIGTGGVPPMAFYMAGSAVWGFFAANVTGNALIFRENANLFGKVWFPRLAVSCANLLASAVTLGVQLLPVLILAGRWVSPILILPTVQLGLLGMGVGLTISALTVKYRDLHVLVQFGMQLWMYGTPIVYPLSEAGELGDILQSNPVTAPVELLRLLLFGQGTVTAGMLIWSGLVTLGALILCIRLFTRAEKTFLDTV